MNPAIHWADWAMNTPRPIPGFTNDVEPNTTVQTNYPQIKWNAWISQQHAHSHATARCLCEQRGVVSRRALSHHRLVSALFENCCMQKFWRGLLPGLPGSPGAGDLWQSPAPLTPFAGHEQLDRHFADQSGLQPEPAPACHAQSERSVAHQQRRWSAAQPTRL